MLQRYKYMANIVNAILPSHLPPPQFFWYVNVAFTVFAINLLLSICDIFGRSKFCKSIITSSAWNCTYLSSPIFFFRGGGGAEKAIEPTLSFKLLLHYPFTICSLLEVRFLISGSHFKYLSFCTLQSSFYGQLIPPSSQNKSPPHIAPPTQTWMKYIEIYKCKEGA